MRKGISKKSRLKIANAEKTTSEIYSIVLKGVIYSLKSLFKEYYVSENIEALMKYINDKSIITAEEYKKLLSEAKDFYPVIVCALFLQPLKGYTKGFKEKELKAQLKKELFEVLHNIYTDFFMDWLCVVDIDPLLFYRLAAAYKKEFNLQLSISKQINHSLTALEERVLKLQLVEIVSLFLIEQVGIQLGLAGLDYIDYYKYGDIDQQCATTQIIN